MENIIIHVKTVNRMTYKYIATWTCGTVTYSMRLYNDKDLQEYFSSWKNVQFVYE